MKRNFINRRKKNFRIINYIYFLPIFLSFLFFFYFFFYQYEKIVNFSSNILQNFSDEYNYNLMSINISDLNYLNEKEIRNYFKNYIGMSIFLLPLNKISKNILDIKWIDEMSIVSNYKNTLNIVIKEEIPAGIYISNNQKILFSKNLKILDLLESTENYNNLILFYGKNSINNSKELMLNIDDSFKDGIFSATFIENRRWNIKLKNNIVLKMSENDLNNALNNYILIYKNLTDSDLKLIQSIDLRIANQAIIKYYD